jgi:hypothetical protein
VWARTMDNEEEEVSVGIVMGHVKSRQIIKLIAR